MSHHPSTHPVLVGIDGSPEAAVALDWAIDEAARQHRPMTLVHAIPVPVQGAYPDVLPSPAASARDEVLERGVDRVRALSPRTPVSTLTGNGVASVLLADASRDAALVVVGARGRGALASAVLGSTSIDVAAHAHCPVAVIRELPSIEPERPRVVVGSDGSELSRTAIGEAFRQADARGLPLTVVHAWQWQPMAGGLAVLATDEIRQQVVDEEKALAAEAVAGWSEKYPDVVVQQHVLEAHPVQALVEHSRGAELLVVGSRGRGGFRGLMLGSVSQGVLHHAHCPVLVVRDGGDGS